MRKRRGGGWCSSLPIPPSDRGSSVLEVFVTVLLLSALGLALWSGVSAGVRLGRRALHDALAASRMVQLDRVIRQAALRVRTPFWEPGPVEETGPEWLRVSWLDGEPSEGMILERRGSLLIVQVREDPPMAFGPFAELDFGVYEDAGGEPRGLRVSVVPEGKEQDDPQVILASFGGSTIPRGRNP